MLRDELDATLGMCGRPTIAGIDRDIIDTVSPSKPSSPSNKTPSATELFFEDQILEVHQIHRGSDKCHNCP